SAHVSLVRRTRTSSPLPYTTLFRSDRRQDEVDGPRGLDRDGAHPLDRVIAAQQLDTGDIRPGLGPLGDVRQDLPLLLDRQGRVRSEEHTSELQSRFDLVCRLLLANN